MKKVLLTVAIAASLMACGGGEENTKSGDAAATTAASDKSSNPVYQKGLELTGKNDCATCHKVDGTLTGPSFKQIAEKYAGADDAKIADLAKKIIAGGSGNWGATMMTPHPAVSDDDAKAMVQYILLMK